MTPTSTPASPRDVVADFIDCINRGDVAGLGRLMTDDHELRVFDEEPLRGKQANVDAWHGYAAAFPAYAIVVREVAERAGTVAVLGHTTDSHLGLPLEEERDLTLIWLADVSDGLVRSWTLVEDTPPARRAWGLASGA
jgi:ketosteroid isomerase-like protein